VSVRWYVTVDGTPIRGVLQSMLVRMFGVVIAGEITLKVALIGWH